MLLPSLVRVVFKNHFSRSKKSCCKEQCYVPAPTKGPPQSQSFTLNPMRRRLASRPGTFGEADLLQPDRHPRSPSAIHDYRSIRRIGPEEGLTVAQDTGQC